MDDKRFEDLWRSGIHAMRTAHIAPLPEATWDKVRWDNAKEVIDAKIVAGEAGPDSVNNDLESFISGVEGTPGCYRCMVPIYNPQGTLVRCGHQVRRKGRILRHVKDHHLRYRPFLCGGKCGTPDWYGIVFFARFGADTD